MHGYKERNASICKCWESYDWNNRKGRQSPMHLQDGRGQNKRVMLTTPKKIPSPPPWSSWSIWETIPFDWFVCHENRISQCDFTTNHVCQSTSSSIFFFGQTCNKIQLLLWGRCIQHLQFVSRRAKLLCFMEEQTDFAWEQYAFILEQTGKMIAWSQNVQKE